MEPRSSQSHSPPELSDTLSNRPWPSPYASASSATPTLASQDQHYGLSQQARRLQLRNTRFKGPALPFRRISPLLETPGKTMESLTRPINDENSPVSAEKRMLYGENLPQNPVSILQEIHRSTKKKSRSPRPGFGIIFEDDIEKGQAQHASETSWYQEGSRNCSPATSHTTPIHVKKLREGSLNPKTPPTPRSSQSSIHVKGRTSNRGSTRSTSSEASKYIEHLEYQLAAVNTKLDSLVSPTSNKLRSAKLRALGVENRSLRLEITDWENKFDSRVREESDQRSAVEMELRVRMQNLEDEMDLRDAKIKELEWEVDSMRARIRDAEGLEEVNASLEKRIEVLTSLLVQSPAKLDISSTSTSPTREDPSKRTSRPRSMLTRMPSSPCGRRLSLTPVSEFIPWEARGIASSPSIAESPENGNILDQDEPDLQSQIDFKDMRPPAPRRQSRQSEAFEHRSGSSISHRSTPSSASRPMSLRSSGSIGPIPRMSWGLPSPEQGAQSATRSRKMRRFPSGFGALRPLILPSTTAGPSLPASAPVYSSMEATPKRDPSDASLDPTTAFLSTLADNPLLETPSHPGRGRSATWVQEQTLNALEGKRRTFEGTEGAHVSSMQLVALEESDFGFRQISSDWRGTCSRPRSLHKELEEANQEQVGDSPETGQEDGQHGRELLAKNTTPLSASLGITSPRYTHLAKDSDPTPKPSHTVIPLALTTPLRKVPSSTTLLPDYACGIFVRLANLIFQTKQDPLVLARRLLYNAWLLGSKRLGGLGWWLLGLVYGTRWRRSQWCADSGIVEEDKPKRTFDWQHFSAEASRSRATEHHLGEFEATPMKRRWRESWLSPPHINGPEPHGSRIMPPIIPSQTARQEPHLFPCDDCVEPSSRRTFRLWFQFSLVIILAVGVAVKNGPGTLLANPVVNDDPREREPLLPKRQERSRSGLSSNVSDDTSEPSRAVSGASDASGGSLPDSGYGSIIFAETLGPADFERLC